MRTFSLIWGPRCEFSGPTSFEITVLPDLLDKMRTSSLMWGPHCEFTGPRSFETTVLPDLLDKCGPYFLCRDYIVNLLVFFRKHYKTFSHIWGPHREFTDPTSLGSIILYDLID